MELALKKFIAVRAEVGECLLDCKEVLKEISHLFYSLTQENTRKLELLSLNITKQINDLNILNQENLPILKELGKKIMDEKETYSYMLGKFETIHEENNKFQVECLTELREIKTAYIEHGKEDQKQFEAINLSIAETKGKVKGIIAIVTTVVALVGFGFPLLSKYMGW